MNSPSYRDALDLVVETDNAEIIAYCTLWDDPVSKIAILEPVACVREYRRKGIMKSTLLYGMNTECLVMSIMFVYLNCQFMK